MKERLFFLAKFYAVTVAAFLIGKLAFMFYNGTELTVGDMAAVLTHGLSLDLSTALYVLSVPLLVMMATIFTGSHRIVRSVLTVYEAVVALVIALALMADTCLYEFWLFKLDASCLQYLETPTEAMASVSAGYLVVRALVLMVAVAVLFMSYRVIAMNMTRSRRWIVELVVFVAFMPLMVIGIRGGLGESTTNIGQVYFSERQFLNHAAVNPVFSFVASFEKTATNNVTYHFMDDAACEQIVSSLYNTESRGCDTLRTTDRPNIIVILLESLGGTFTEIGGRNDVTPCLNRLSREGVYFANCYGNTWRTDRGTVCTLSGYPSFPTMSVMKMPAKSRSLPNLAQTLRQERGYETHYLYGGDINFTNMRSYLIGGGFRQLTWMDDYSREEQQTSQWGVRDDITFETLLTLTQQLKEPFLIGYSTLSSHAPWDVPIQQFDDEVLNAFYYLDQCVGRFITQLQQSDKWQSTLVVLLPDHGIPYHGIDETNPLKNHIPMIWVGGAVKEPRRIEQVCNQTDLVATLLGQLGINHDDYAFSRDVLSETYTEPCAINTYDDGFSMYDSTSFVNYDFISNRVVASQGNNNEALIRRAKAILQAASKDLNEK